MKTINFKLKKKLHEVYFIEPNDLGIGVITKIYKVFTKPIKTMPFIFILPISVFIALTIYIIFGVMIIRLATIFQYGF